MAAIPTKQLGVTPPISLSFPTDSELAANDALIAELKKQNNFEGVEETEKRSVFPFLTNICPILIGLQEANTTAYPENHDRICEACQ